MEDQTSTPTESPRDGRPAFEVNASHADDVAFDEMNLVELPFALLTRDTNGVYEIPLSADGSSRLACLKSSKYGLPNSLAPRVLLGLMWLWRSEYTDADQTFTFKLRELIERYMYPSRDYPPNGDLQRAVERQIHCIAGSRIHTDRWHDRRRKTKIEADINILGAVAVEDPGGRNRPRVLRVDWGLEFWRSMVHRYTKPIDARLVQSLSSPLDLQLYRLLDRQLATKPSQKYNNIVNFARFRLGMQGAVLDAGGRTASSYVAKKIRSSLRRLSREQFTVRATIDSSHTPYSIIFERVEPRRPEQPHEVVSEDRPAELIREFEFLAHGVPRAKRRTRVRQAHRDRAQEWIDAYGFEKAKWMVQHAVRTQKARGRQPIQVFAGLQLYEAEAAGAFEAHAAEAGRRRRADRDQDADRIRRCYERALVEAFDKGDINASKVLDDETYCDLRERHPSLSPESVRAMAHARTNCVKLERMNALETDEFKELFAQHGGASDPFRVALRTRHGFDPLAPTTTNEQSMT